jgi:hypothetical protein
VGTEHEITLTGLTPATKYFYSIGTTAKALPGGDADHFFVTSPNTGTAKSARVWVIGDSGTCGQLGSPLCNSAKAVRDSYLNFTGTRKADVWLMLGDNAYPEGTEQQYEDAVYDTYPMLLRQTVLWPSLGNHDANTDGVSVSSSQTGPYFDSFRLPTRAEAGGIASGTEAYYSFDYGNIHFIVLDSSDPSSRLPGSAMLTWLTNDLAATRQDWIIAFWHHCPYCKGSRDSDTDTDLVEMRANVVPILEAGGVDLVLTGHSHSYERSRLIDGFYGTPTTLFDGVILDAGDGRVDGTGVYSKPTLGPAPHEGTVYAVVGSSGGQFGECLDGLHPLMIDCLPSTGPSAAPGSLVLDIAGNRLEARFIDGSCALQDDGRCVADSFTIVKGSPTINLSRLIVDFGWVPVGTTSAAKQITISNSGRADLKITSITEFFPPDPSQCNTFHVSHPRVPFTIASGGRQIVEATFTPSGSQMFACFLKIASNDPASPSDAVKLVGRGTRSQVVSVTLSALKKSVRQGEEVPFSVRFKNRTAEPQGFVFISILRLPTGQEVLLGPPKPMSLPAHRTTRIERTLPIATDAPLGKSTLRVIIFRQNGPVIDHSSIDIVVYARSDFLRGAQKKGSECVKHKCRSY